jgi:hypothetical protein
MVSEQELEQRVRKGIALLDSKIADWRGSVNVDGLNMIFWEFCLVAQVYPEDDYRIALAKLDIGRN